MSDKKPVLIDQLEMPKARRSKPIEDKFGIGALSKIGQVSFIAAGKKDKLISLRASINKHKQFWEKKTGNAYSVHWTEYKGEQGFGVWLVEKPKK